MKTRTELVHRALRNLGALPQGESPDVQELNRRCSDRSDDRALDSSQHHSDHHFLALGHVLAGHALSEFGLQNDPALAARAQRGEQDLKEIDMNTVRYKHMSTMHSDYPDVRPLVNASTLF
jgi:hypothetical protein